VTATLNGLGLLEYHYANRLAAAQQAHAAGKRVVGAIGNTVPRELIDAAGLFPVLVAAEPEGTTATAEIYMEPVISPETKALFELAAGSQGQLEFLDLLVLSRPFSQLYYYLKEVHRMGRAPHLPALHMFDLMQSQRDSTRTYNARQIQALRDRLAPLAESAIDDQRLEMAMLASETVRRRQRDLQELRWRGVVPGVDALKALGAAYFMAPEAYTDALSSYLGDLASAPRLDRPRLLVLSSEPLSHPHLHAAVEDAGGLVVAEDDWWGSRAAGSETTPDGESAMERLLNRYWLDTATNNVWPADARESWFRESASRDETDGVVFYLPPSDHQLGWDYPRLHRWLDSVNRRSLLIRDEARDADGRTAITNRVREWLNQ
jgi:benzoyl-CoA reductase/2-hydroxyglutaryl-CoA dehydratase subunit BcrC/BadD/HgdB